MIENLRKMVEIDRIIKSKIRQLDDLKKYAITVKTSDYSSERVQTSRSITSSVEEVILRIEKFEEVINDDINNLIRIKAETRKYLNNLSTLNGIEKLILELRYFEAHSWNNIIRELNYGEAHIFRLHRSAMKKVVENTKMRVNESKECDIMIS